MSATTEQEYMSVEDASKLLGWNRATTWGWIRTLGLEAKHFLRNRRAYLSREDVALLQEIQVKPWLADEVKRNRERQAPLPQPNEPAKFDVDVLTNSIVNTIIEENAVIMAHLTKEQQAEFSELAKEATRENLVGFIEQLQSEEQK